MVSAIVAVSRRSACTSGPQRTNSRCPVDKLSSTTGRKPARASDLHVCAPTYPAPPATRTALRHRSDPPVLLCGAISEAAANEVPGRQFIGTRNSLPQCLSSAVISGQPASAVRAPISRSERHDGPLAANNGQRTTDNVWARQDQVNHHLHHFADDEFAWIAEMVGAGNRHGAVHRMRDGCAVERRRQS